MNVTINSDIVLKQNVFICKTADWKHILLSLLIESLMLHVYLFNLSFEVLILRQHPLMPLLLLSRHQRLCKAPHLVTLSVGVFDDF